MSGRTLVCAATAIEARACARGVSRTGTEVLRTGMGHEPARKVLLERLRDRRRPLPDLIVSSGFAGSLRPDLRPGTWVAAKTIRWEAEAPRPLDPLASLPALSSPGLALKWTAVDFVSRARVSPRSETRAAGAVDLESWAWMEISERFGIPFLVLRLVSDSPEEPLPECAARLASARGPLALGYAAIAAIGGWRETSRFLSRSIGLPGQLERGWRAVASAQKGYPSST